jgi:hypothetical protein
VRGLQRPRFLVAFWVLLLEGCFGITFRGIAKLSGVMFVVLEFVCLEGTCFKSVFGSQVRSDNKEPSWQFSHLIRCGSNRACLAQRQS